MNSKQNNNNHNKYPQTIYEFEDILQRSIISICSYNYYNNNNGDDTNINTNHNNSYYYHNDDDNEQQQRPLLFVTYYSISDIGYLGCHPLHYYYYYDHHLYPSNSNDDNDDDTNTNNNNSSNNNDTNTHYRSITGLIEELNYYNNHNLHSNSNNNNTTTSTHQRHHHNQNTYNYYQHQLHFTVSKSQHTNTTTTINTECNNTNSIIYIDNSIAPTTTSSRGIDTTNRQQDDQQHFVVIVDKDNDDDDDDNDNETLLVDGHHTTLQQQQQQLTYIPPSLQLQQQHNNHMTTTTKQYTIKWIDLRQTINHYDLHNHLCTTRENLIYFLSSILLYDKNCSNNYNNNTCATTTSNSTYSLLQQINQYSPWFSTTTNVATNLNNNNNNVDNHCDNINYDHNHNIDNDSSDQVTLTFDIADCTILVLPILKSNNKNHESTYHTNNERDRNDYSLLSSFRISDICPSIALYSSAYMDFSQLINDGDNNDNLYSWLILPNDNDTNNNMNVCQVFVYRKLPHRELLSSIHPITKQIVPIPGCLYETVISYPSLDENDNDTNDNNQNDNATSINNQQKEQEQVSLSIPIIQYRIVGPPYLHEYNICNSYYLQTIYNHMKSFFLQHHVQQILYNELQQIQQYFIAWPEQQHYTSSTNDIDQNNYNTIDTTNTIKTASAVVATWNVFPLCYCFPGNDISCRKWIHKTCSIVPQTIELLKECFTSIPINQHNDNINTNINHDSYVLRTALFSRLEPDSVLEAHTGWADLANHVYRVHIPIDIPKPIITNYNSDTNNNELSSLSNSLLCGTWVDGCVQYHTMDDIIIFDDSKIHRAFNYSHTQSRTVLIVDIERSTNTYNNDDNYYCLPIGTAIGGHSNELDDFIQQFQ